MAKEKTGKRTKNSAASGIKNKLDEKTARPTFEPDSLERKVLKYVKRRMDEMIEFRRSLNIEPRWKQADEEYVPHELDYGTTRKRFETDQDTGLRSRMVPVGDASQQWRQAASAPTLLAKIQTAVSILVDQQPEAELVALLKKYQGTTDLAYALWKRNWQITGAKEKLKLIIFDLIKYGWAAQRTIPRLIKYPKRILIEKDTQNPENDKYEDTELEWFNDIDREHLNPFRTWIDEMTKPYEPYSNNECYYELDYSYDSFMTEFGQYPNSEFVPRDSAMQRSEEQTADTNRQTVARSQSMTNQSKVRKDIVTVGFFQSRPKDLYVLYIPAHKIILYISPLPNDDGYLDITQTMWILRSSNLPYGISLWEIIRQNKMLYDKMKNMTMDQLVLSIMKFGFFSGTNTVLGDGKIDIVPGQARQLTSSTGKPEINWMEIPGPGKDAWQGLEAVASMMDDESGISPTLEGEVTGKTLGEILHAKEAALKRLKTPVANIAWFIEQDAYLTLSWMSQTYTIPTVKEFADEKEMIEYEKENDLAHSELFAQINEETGETTGIQAHYLPQLSLHLEDRDGKLHTSKASKFFQVGEQKDQIHPKKLKWRGIFKVIPRSIIDSSQELLKATKMEMFNMLVPLLQFPAEIVAKAAKQIIKINEEDPKDWLPDAWIQYLDNAGQQMIPGMAPIGPQGGPPLFVPAGGGNGQTMQNQAGMTPKQAPTIVPQGQITPPGQMPGANIGRGLFNRKL